MEDLSVYREVFIEELVDQLERMDQDFLALEQCYSIERVQSLFRAVHTIKGSSAAMEFEEMKHLTHEIEYVLDRVRSDKLQVDQILMNLLFQSLDFLKQLRDEYMKGGPFSDHSALLADIRSFSQEPKKQQHVPELPELTLEQALKVEECRESGLQVWTIRLRLSADCLMKGARFHLVAQRLAEEFGDLIISNPSAASFMDSEQDDEWFTNSLFVLASGNAAKEIEDELLSYSDVEEADVCIYSPLASNAGAYDNSDASSHYGMQGSINIQSIHSTPSAPSITGNPGNTDTSMSSSRNAAAEFKGTQPEEKQKQGPQTIRVHVERLEQLMNLVGELLIDQTSLAELKQTAAQRFPGEEFADRLGAVSDRMTRIVGELQESVMKARMLPIEHLFNRFPRMVRDLSQKLGKEIELVLEGMETELDRTVIEEIGDPLIHLLRNSVDHGVEMPDVRTSKGKPAKGRIRLNSFHENNQVVITIQDDGAGISAEKVKASALHKGIITEEEALRLSEQDAINLIFRPGFSTAASVSEVSGRGVGMDIVRSQITRLNGLIDIQTKPDQGTCFSVKLPLTLAIITGLMVKVGERDFAIPMNNVLEIVRLPVEEIQTIQGDTVVMIRNQVIPLLWLHDVLRYERAERSHKFLQIVVVGSAEKRVALAVDELRGNQEIVIKSLGGYLGKMDYITGATILGNGRVALILEVTALVQASRTFRF
ncbi:chemotaxis protein CheA [Paenibacillus eucommiae]|uniref:Chemotaxis protein CheA n=1 Tax=Paenibacillus eucommiae TaxID=1355755 RepID=A0ABS4IVY8_9BACL|nr:chemotaxis protein CheA [Paenibacillus eucommiae]MBP1990689.1 two-component system chemotaxis sensor kinase CheA [Paenibacillus eucommiae]